MNDVHVKFLSTVFCHMLKCDDKVGDNVKTNKKVHHLTFKYNVFKTHSVQTDDNK